MTNDIQDSKSELRGKIAEILNRADNFGSSARSRNISELTAYITANYTDTNDYVALEAEMELLKYKLRKAEALLD